MPAFIQSAVKKLISTLILFYRYTVSPIFGGGCRFYPSCSCYAEDSIKKYPVYKAVIKIILRFFKCHPFSKGGFDPA